jgi:hypothetical protein
MEASIPHPPMLGETVFSPTASGHQAPVVLPPTTAQEQWTPKPDNNANILGKYAPIAGLSIFGFFMVVFWFSWREQASLTTKQIEAAQEQVGKFYTATAEQHALDRAAQIEQRNEDRKVRREELGELKTSNEKIWTFTRELQLILIEDSGSLKQLKGENKETVNAVRLNQQVIIELQKSITGKKHEIGKPIPLKPEPDDDEVAP